MPMPAAGSCASISLATS